MVKIPGIELNERDTWFITAHTISFLFNQIYGEILTHCGELIRTDNVHSDNLNIFIMVIELSGVQFGLKSNA